MVFLKNIFFQIFFFFYFFSMQLFSADAMVFSKKKIQFFDPRKVKKQA